MSHYDYDYRLRDPFANQPKPRNAQAPGGLDIECCDRHHTTPAAVVDHFKGQHPKGLWSEGTKKVKPSKLTETWPSITGAASNRHWPKSKADPKMGQLTDLEKEWLGKTVSFKGGHEAIGTVWCLSWKGANVVIPTVWPDGGIGWNTIDAASLEVWDAASAEQGVMV